MEKFFQYSVLLLLIDFTVIRSEENIHNQVDYYVDLINNRTEAAVDYQFPIDASEHETTDECPQEYGEFDFIVVGGGSTGCVVANRLSEVPEWKVLLLEAGTFPDDDLTGIPALWTVDSFSKFNWGFESIPQKHSCLGNEGQKCKVPRGKGIGGSSLVNAIIYSTGNKIDYDRWADLLDDPNWNYENVLPVFKLLENFTRSNPFDPIDEDYHGHDGLLQISQRIPTPKMSQVILKASQQLGYNLTDYNGKHQLGVSIDQSFIKNGRRYDNGRAFISGIKNRKNLVVLDKSYVTKIEISPVTKQAIGVIFTRENKLYIARNTKEVILSAGAISSPQILMLSGIGIPDHLEPLGIPVIQNLPVGHNLHDHPASILVVSTNLTDGIESIEKSVKDFLKGEGVLTSALAFDTAAWFKTPTEQNEYYPNLEIAFTNFSGSVIAQKFFGWTDETFQALNANVPNPLYMYLVFLHPKSKGTVKLKSKSPFDYPLIDLNLLGDKDDFDIEALYQGVQMILKLIKTQAFRSVNATLAFNQFPGCHHTEPLSKEYWYCYLRRVSYTLHHPISTCRTGTNPKTAVVDKKLQVFGIQRLRVADASIIPFPITCNTNAPCTMIGQKVSDLIIKIYKP